MDHEISWLLISLFFSHTSVDFLQSWWIFNLNRSTPFLTIKQSFTGISSLINNYVCHKHIITIKISISTWDMTHAFILIYYHYSNYDTLLLFINSVFSTTIICKHKQWIIYIFPQLNIHHLIICFINTMQMHLEKWYIASILKQFPQRVTLCLMKCRFFIIVVK